MAREVLGFIPIIAAVDLMIGKKVGHITRILTGRYIQSCQIVCRGVYKMQIADAGSGLCQGIGALVIRGHADPNDFIGEMKS